VGRAFKERFMFTRHAALRIARPHEDAPDDERPGSDIHELLAGDIFAAVATQPVRGARALIEALVRAGVDTYFGVPGGPAAPLFQALDEVPGARLVESRQETAAAFEAAGYFRATGKIAAVIVTAGPGATAAVTGVVSASLERVPMIVIAGDVAWATTGGRLAQDSGPDGVALEEMFAKATRAQVRVARPESAASQALYALDVALDSERPGPVLLVVPMQHGAATITPGRTSRRRRERWSAEVDGEAVREACETLASARRPLIVIGGGCRRHAEAMRKLVDAIDVPFVTTPSGKGIVSEHHPRSLRHGGLAASLWARAYTKDGVDGCVVLGTDLDDASIGPTRYVAEGGKLIHVDLDARVFHRNLAAALGVVADVEAFADAMRLHWTSEGLWHGNASREVRRLKMASAPYDVPESLGHQGTIAPHRAILDLASAFPDAMFCSDIGEHMLFALHYLTAKGPDAFHIQLSLGSMGSGIATSIGLALGAPGRRVVCIAGDGCMQMMGSELLVAVKERLPIVFAVFNDARYNMVHHGMKQLYGRTRAWDTGTTIDFVKWADAFGIPARRIEGGGEIDGTEIDALLGRGGPVVLDVRIDREIRLKGAGRVESLQQMSAHEITGGAR
jgi:acetolactate synthase I/II/III large subunit